MTALRVLVTGASLAAEARHILESIGAAYRDVMGKNFPVMSVVQVVALMEAQAKVEIEATAVVPPAMSEQ